MIVQSRGKKEKKKKKKKVVEIYFRCVVGPGETAKSHQALAEAT